MASEHYQQKTVLSRNTWTRDAKRPGGNKKIVRQRASLQKKVEAKEAKCRRIGVVHQAVIAG